MDLLSRFSPLVEKKRKYPEINNEPLTTLTLCSGYPITKIHTRNLLDKTRFFNSETMKQNQQQQQEEKSGISTESTLFSPGDHHKLIYENPNQNMINRPTLVDEVSGRDDTSVSTQLSLSWNNINPKPELPRRNLEDPWKIKKQLKGSDLGHMSRLLFPTDSVNKHIKPLLKKEQFEMVEKEGFKVRVWDCDTRSEHNLVFKRWYSSKGYVFLNGWIPEFVKRRNLKEGDIVGVYWDVSKSRFNFFVLRRASNSHVVVHHQVL